MNEVVIMMGIPGSGKSTYAKTLDATVLSTDDYWYRGGAGYLFTPNLISEAHSWNLRRFTEYVRTASEQDVVVDNTNCSIAEIAPYAALTFAYNRTLTLKGMLCDVPTALLRQTHGVPAHKVYQMHLQLEQTIKSLPAWWSFSLQVTA